MTDSLAVPPGAAAGGELQFLLHGALRVTSSDPPVSEVPLDPKDAVRFFGINSSTADLYARAS